MIKNRHNLIANLESKSNINVSMEQSKNIEVEIAPSKNIEVSIDKMTFYHSRGEMQPHTHNAEEVNYFTEADVNIATVKDALDKLLYVPLSISLISNKPTTLEIGTTINSVVFSWTYNKNIVSQKFNNEALEANLRSYTYNSSFNSNKSFKLEANDGEGNFNKSINFNFLNGRYWGVSNSNEYDSNFVLSLSKELASSKAKTFTVNCGSGQHIFYCIPSSFGTPTFTVGGFSGGFNKIQTIQFTNASGFTENYDIWKSTNSNLGSTTVVVS
jgi:hypothetical protein